MRGMKLVVGVLLFAGCAAGGRPFEPPTDDAPVTPPADGPVSPDPQPDAMVLPPDAPPDSLPPPPDACVPVITEVLANGSLDGTPIGTGWTQVLIQGLEGGPYPIITADGLAAVSAPNKAWMGGAAGLDAGQPSVSDALFQQITFPADATTFVVTGMFATGTVEDQDDVYDTFRLDVTDVNGTPIENVLQLNNLTPAAPFAAFSKSLTGNYAGMTVQLRATSTNDVINHTNFFLDSLSFKATFCP